MFKDGFEKSANEALSQHLPSLKQAQEDFGGVYLAILPSIDDGIYAIEVEVSEGTIALTWHTGTKNITYARHEADFFEQVLKKHGINVFKTRDAWEAALEF